MDTNEALKKLLKIAQKQQKALEKLAQDSTRLPVAAPHFGNAAQQIKTELDKKLPSLVANVALKNTEVPPGGKEPVNMYTVTFYQGSLTEANKGTIWPTVMAVVKQFDPNAGAVSAEANFPSTYHSS